MSAVVARPAVSTCRGAGHPETGVVQRIEDYAVLGDLQTAALVGRDGSVDWLCLPRFDSPACFAALLDTPDAGRWRIAPVGAETCTSRSYRGLSLILESEWRTADGTVRVVDLMPPRGEAPDVVRIVEGVSGRVRVRSELRLRFDYGNVTPWVRHVGSQLAAVAGPDCAWLRTDVPLEGHDGATWAEFEVGPGDRVPFVLTYQVSHRDPPRPVNAFHALEQTELFWQDWTGRCDYDGGWADAVRGSLVVLKGLTYAPSGGIVAAATTSLPEEIGGVRNWDYRYCWLRDATLTLQALLGAGYVDEARAWRDWLLRAVAGDPPDLKIMYGIHGERRLPEYDLPWLRGYEGSSPVRVGNAAADQFQLDVWGTVLEGLHVARESGLAPSDDAWDLQRALMNHLEGHWQDADRGLWEVRGPERRFVHSQVMAWAGADRMVRAVERFGVDGPVDRWRATRDEIHRTVCAEGYDAERRTFTQHFGGASLDASLLLIPRVGFLPWDDERVAGTVDAVRRELCEDGLVLRYRTDDGGDGLPGREGAFVACSFWLVDALEGTGRRDEAVALFERLLALRNDVGLLSEEYDTVAKRQVGNVPQAFSHLALVTSALQLSHGREAATSDRSPVVPSS
jgi:GH15 family glucan-1,4-alpha-glucosidase